MGPGRPGPKALEAAAKLVAEGNVAIGGDNVAFAEHRAKKALEQVPEYLPALQLLRLCRQRVGAGGPEHEQVLRRILNQNPNELHIIAELVALLFNRGEMDECEHLARKALRLVPTNANVHGILGLLLSRTNRAAAGEFHFRRVIALDGEKPHVAGNLANCLKLQGKVEESELWFRKATALDPNDANVWLGWSRLEEARRDLPRAWETLRRAEAAEGGDRAEFAMHRAILLDREGNTEEAVNELIRSRERGERLGANALLDRGRFYDKLDRFDDAWADFVEGNRLVREVQRKRYSESIVKEQVSELKRFFTRARMELIPCADADRSVPQPIFVVGFPRSGTTMVEQTLTAHPLISAGDELMFIYDLVRIAPRWLASPNTFPGCLADLWMGDNQLVPNQMRDYYLRRCHELGIFAEGARFFTDKMPLNEMHLGLIHILFPHSPIIHVRRHPLDILTSNFSNYLTHGFNQSFDVRTIAQHYALIEDLVQHYRRQLNLNYLEIRYEELVENQELHVRRMLEFVGVDFDQRCLSFHENQRFARTASYAQVTNKLYDSSVHRYRNYRKHLDEAVSILKPTLAALGYPSD